MFNTVVVQSLRNKGIDPNEGLLYLLALHYRLEFDRDKYGTMCDIIDRMNIFMILPSGDINWKHPVFENQVIEFEWVVTEFLDLYKSRKLHNRNKRECTARMKWFFIKYPEYRKDDVLNATKLYLYETRAREDKFIMKPMNFIKKGRGTEEHSELLSYVEQYKDLVKKKQEQENVSMDITRRTQI